MTPVFSLRLSSVSPTAGAEYVLEPPYKGKTLLNIVQQCMGSFRTMPLGQLGQFAMHVR